MSLIDCIKESLTRPGSQVLTPTDAGYSQATIPYNTRFADSVGPLAVVFVHTAPEIAGVVSCCSTYNVPAVPRSGGHSYGAYSLGGSISPGGSSLKLKGKEAWDAPRAGEASVILDLRGMRHMEYITSDETIEVGSGVMLGELINELDRKGRMMPTGSCPTVGVGGQALAGGYGLSSRKYGLLLDQLVSIEAVLASGEIVHVSDRYHPDLFWAMRGGGGSFGIAYSFKFRTHRQPSAVYYYELTLLPRVLGTDEVSIERATSMFMAFQEFAQTAAAVPQLGLAWHATPEKGPDGWGTKIEILGQYMGQNREFERAMERFHKMLKKYEVGEVKQHDVKLSYIQSAHHVGGDWSQLRKRGKLNMNEHEHFYVKSYVTKQDLTRDVVREHIKDLLHMSPVINTDSGVEWFILGPYLGGDSAIYGQSNGAFAHRDIRIMFEMYAKRAGEGSTVDTVEVVNRMVQSLGPPEATYPAYVDTEIPAGAYPKLMYGKSYKRLQKIKAEYDPKNVFRQPQSIRAGRYRETTYELDTVEPLKVQMAPRDETREELPVGQHPPVKVEVDTDELDPSTAHIDWPRAARHRINTARVDSDGSRSSTVRTHFILLLFVMAVVSYGAYSLRRKKAKRRLE